MSAIRTVVDHLRLNYTGPFDANDLFRHITAFLNERGLDLKIDKEFDHITRSGKQIEWQINPSNRLTDYIRFLPKIRVLVNDYSKVDAIVDNKKVKVGHGKVVMYIDAYLELDESNRWENYPAFQFLRSLYNIFFYKVYTERFEHRLNQDMYHLYHTIEQFFNIYRDYHVVSRIQLMRP